MANNVETFLVRFVVEAERDEARESMSDLFAELHSALARDFLKSYNPKKAKNVDVAKCQAKTAKGEDCPRKCCAESDEFCAMHLKQSQKPEKSEKSEKSEKAKKVEVAKCQAKTAKGGDCPRKCCVESDEFCALHLKQSQKPEKSEKPTKESKGKKSKKDKVPKRVAEHNHELTEKVDESVAENCDLCQTHGNTMDPDLTEEDFEGVSEDMQSRLQAILNNIGELDEAEPDESNAGPSKPPMEEEDFDDGECEVDMPDVDFGDEDDEDEDEVEVEDDI